MDIVRVHSEMQHVDVYSNVQHSYVHSDMQYVDVYSDMKHA